MAPPVSLFPRLTSFSQGQSLSAAELEQRRIQVLVPFYRSAFKWMTGREPGEVREVEMVDRPEPGQPIRLHCDGPGRFYPLLGIATDACISSIAGRTWTNRK